MNRPPEPANARTALERLEPLVRSGMASVQVRGDAQLKVDVARAEVAAAQSALDADTVRAPVAGRVVAVHARRGERVGPDGIAELAETDQMYAIAEVYETDIGRVKLGQNATLRSPALADPLTGAVDRIGQKIGKLDLLDADPVARTDARVVDVRIRLDDSPRAAALSNLQVESRSSPERCSRLPASPGSSFVLGVDPAGDALAAPGMEERLRLVRYPDRAIFEEASRPEFGPVPALFRAHGDVSTEVNDRRLTIQGLFRLGTSFGVDGTILTSGLNDRRLFPSYPPGAVGLGLVRVRPGVDPRAVRDALVAGLPHDVRVLTTDEFMRAEVAYWSTKTPIGFVFAFGVVIGLVVGMIIVYQILFADIADHLAEYATLKAMGYANRYLSTVVVMEATILAALGYLPGMAIALWLFDVAHRATMLPMVIAPDRAAEVLGLTLAMYWASGLIAMRKLRTLDPADVF